MLVSEFRCLLVPQRLLGLESAGPPARLKPFPVLFSWSLLAEEGALRPGTFSAEEGAQEPREGSAPGLGLELG